MSSNVNKAVYKSDVAKCDLTFISSVFRSLFQRRKRRDPRQRGGSVMVTAFTKTGPPRKD